MSRGALLLGLLVACKSPATADPPKDTGAPLPPPLPVDAAQSATMDERVRDAVRRWNQAHAERNASALESIYAESVDHYGTKMSRANVVKAKAAAFAATPDFTQAIGKIDVEPGLAANDRWARFTKSVTQKGKTKDHPALLVFNGDRLTEEKDDVDWCRSGDGSGTNDRVVPPFTMSGAAAVEAAYKTKHLAEHQKKYPGAMIDVRYLSCPKVCVKSSYECGFSVRTSDMEAKTPSNLLEWLYVDPIERKLWFTGEDGGWQSEPLPALTTK